MAEIDRQARPASQDRDHALPGQRLVAKEVAHNLLANFPSIGGEHLDPAKHRTFADPARQQPG